MIVDTVRPMTEAPMSVPTGDVEDMYLEPSPMHEAGEADWEWLRGEYDAHRLEQVMDRWVVILDKRIVESGPDGHGIRMKAASDFGVHPNRLVLAYISHDQLIG